MFPPGPKVLTKKHHKYNVFDRIQLCQFEIFPSEKVEVDPGEILWYSFFKGGCLMTTSGGKEFAWFLMRLILGVGVALHGYQLLFSFNYNGDRAVVAYASQVASLGLPFPALLAWAIATIQLGGGVLIILGLLGRLMSFLVLLIMAMEIFQRWDQAFSAKELFLVYGVLCLAILIGGSGAASLDAAIHPKRGSPPIEENLD